MEELELKIECPICGVRAFEDCYVRPNEPYTIKYRPMMHEARIVQKTDETSMEATNASA
jgi:hypothetical protein